MQNRLRALEEKLQKSSVVAENRNESPSPLQQRIAEIESGHSPSPNTTDDFAEDVQSGLAIVSAKANNKPDVPISAGHKPPNTLFSATQLARQGDIAAETAFFNITPSENSQDQGFASPMQHDQTTILKPVLHEATEQGHSVIVEMLLEKGACISARDSSGATSLHLAAQRGNVAISKILLRWHANPNLLDYCGNSPMHYAIEESHCLVLDALLEGGADTNIQNLDGRTVLHLVASNGNKSAVAKLVQQNESLIAVKDFFGSTALSVAVTKGDAGIVRILLDHGADPNSTI
ncbi:hypothetical protein TrVGV298_000016 [Trichoderma virens]|nr:hypothetical protein TrVGV298_000016 [Trichoderma virens]